MLGEMTSQMIQSLSQLEINQSVQLQLKVGVKIKAQWPKQDFFSSHFFSLVNMDSTGLYFFPQVRFLVA